MPVPVANLSWRSKHVTYSLVYTPHGTWRAWLVLVYIRSGFPQEEEDEFSEVSEVPPREEMVLKLKIVDENT